jgi:lipoate-protein ligase A
VADGPQNMAADEVLLEAAARGIASLRFYGWSEATLSLGYFQSERVRHADAALARLPYVRRPTGGATLVHHHELTYALGLPAGAPWQNGEPWLRRMHAIIAVALAELQVTTHMQAVTSKEPFGAILCFQHATAGDLLSSSAKIVGSAQRRKRGMLLQHGAILLARSPHAPVLLGIQELSGHTLPADRVAAAVACCFACVTGWQMIAEDWSAAERQRMKQLVGERFARDSWNGKR